MDLANYYEHVGDMLEIDVDTGKPDYLKMNILYMEMSPTSGELIIASGHYSPLDPPLSKFADLTKLYVRRHIKM